MSSSLLDLRAPKQEDMLSDTLPVLDFRLGVVAREYNRGELKELNTKKG